MGLRERLPSYETLEAAWLCRVWRPVERFAGAAGTGLQTLFSREGFSLGGHILLFLGLISGWVLAPIQGKLRSLAVPLLSALDLSDPSARPLSAGTVLALLLLVAWVTKARPRRAAAGRGAPGSGAWLARPAWWGTAAGAAAVLLAYSFLLQLAFLRPEVLRDLLGELQQLQRMKYFDTLFIQGNIGSIRVPILRDDTLGGQLYAVLDRVGSGVWYTAAGGILLLVSGFRELRRRRPEAAPMLARSHVAFASLMALLFAALCAPSLLADALRERAHRQAAEGAYLEALDTYRRAAGLDARLSINDAFLLRMGGAMLHAGDRDSPEARYYLARYHRDRKEHGEAERQIEEALRALEEADRPLELRAFRRKLAEILVEEGILLLQREQPYAAMVRWERAREIQPDSLEIPFFMARVRYQRDGPDQEAAIALNEHLLGRTRDRILRSDLYCNLGESYTRKGDLAAARRMYEESLDTYNYVKDINYRAMKGMIGL